jgi:ABC-type Na+ efflux pump permease subunit
MAVINGKTSIVVSMVGVFVMLLLTIVNITSGYSDKEVAEMKAKLDSIDTRTINTDRDVAVLKERYKSIDESLDDIKETLKDRNK